MDPEEDAGDDVSFYEDDDEGTSDITDLGEPDERWELSLKQCLDDLKPGQITFFKEYHEFANPGIKVEHHPEIPLPLTERGAEAIKSVCRQPRFGHDDKTVVDTTVRNTWELGYTQYKLQNPHWMKFLSKIVGDAGHELGIERVVAVPHRMLLYEPGSHKDTEQEAGTLGTLVICLPSKHEGSNVNLSHRAEKHTLRTAPTSAYDVTALAWYSEVAHEVEELTSGYRLVLTHKLLQVSGNRLTAETFFSQKEQLRSILSPQQLLNMSSQILAYGLDHQYTQSSFSLKNLKGRDQTLCHALRNLCSESGLYVFLAHVVRSKYEIDDDEIYSGYYEDEDQANQDATTKLENVYSLDGELIATSVEIALGDVLGISYTDREPDSTEKCDYMGNETSTHRYHDAAIIILRTGSMGGFLRPSHHFTSMRTADPKAVAMVKIAAHDLEKHPENPLLELELVTLIKAARECGIVYHIESARILITWGLILGKTSLIVPVLNARLRPEWVDEVNQVIAEVLQKRFDKEKDGVEWNKLYAFFLSLMLG